MIIPPRWSAWKAALLFLTTILLTGAAWAQIPIPASTQFDITGFVQEATVTNSADPHSGGTLKVNGHTITVPSNTVVILPANALTWQELFATSPAPYTGIATGMALADVPAPMSTYEVHVIGNRVLPDANHATDQYIAGLIYLSQQDLNSGAGFINCIDYSIGEMRVGGTLNDCTTGTRVRINDPVGRFGRAMTPDGRFTVDPDNPTIIAGTGYPMCLPRTDPATADDPLCPQGNRLKDIAGNFVPSIQMPDPATLVAGQLPDPRIQAPLEVGDYITFAGTLVNDSTTVPTEGPFPGTPNTYISAHTITNNVAIYTSPGTNPAYVMTEVTIIGTGGLTVLGVGEAAIRTRFEGMTTDPSRNIHLYGIDLDPRTGATTDRDWGTIGVDPGPPLGAVKGRWRFRPPCTAVGTPTQKDCTPPPAGTFLPPTREVRAVIEGLQGQNPANATAVTTANGIFYGQYHAPILEYIFPENIPGSPIVENNFNTIDFLAKGGYASSGIPGGTSTLAGILSPWPSNLLPPGACTAPIVSAGGPYTAPSGGQVTLSATATAGATPTIAWTAPGTGTLSPPNVLNPVYTAPAVLTQTVVPLSLTVTNNCGQSATAQTTVTINANQPTVNHIAPLTVNSGTPVTLTATGTDPNGLPLTFVWTQTAGAPVVLVPNPFTGATISFTLALPVGAPGTTLQFQVVATNSAGATSAPEFTTVTINPAADTVTVTSAEYRTGKQRVILTATSSVISPSVVLTLQPYLTEQGITFDPTSLGSVFTNTGGGIYTLTLVGAPAPACNLGGTYATPCSQKPIVVKSSLGGVNLGGTALTRIRN